MQEHVAAIVSSYLGDHQVQLEEVGSVIGIVSQALNDIINPRAVEPAKPVEPAVPIRDSVKRYYLVCLECGKRVTMLKPHLRAHGLSPAEYRARWKLLPEYPMAAPDYSARRSELAKEWGLGCRGRRGGDHVSPLDYAADP